MTRDRAIWLLGLLVLVVGAWWLSVNTEWVEVDSWRAARGEARDNPVYAFEQLLRRLGMKAEHHEALDPMPPERARLVLLSNDWELMPGRAEQLHQWVLRGGHLVLVQGQDWDDTALAAWVPVHAVRVKPPERPAVAASGASAAAPASLSRGPHSRIWESIALTSSPPLWGDTPTLAACEIFPMNRKLQVWPGQATSWGMTGDDKAQVLRVPIGQGTVTVLNADDAAFHNVPVLRCENAVLLAAAVQAEPGATAWIYLNEKREALLPWLWHRGWVAVLAGLLALAAALWRGAVRFGPRLAPAPRLRRSISEQVRGLGAYLQRSGHDALLAAQQRALGEAAARTLPRYLRLSMAERAHAIAAATGLAAYDLATAMSARFCTRAELLKHLPLLEAARRRLHRTTDERHPT